jgi:uncharacterized protein YegL
MSLDGKMSTLNGAIHQALPYMKMIADENPNAGLLIRTLRFAKTANFIEQEPIPVEKFVWNDLVAEQPTGGRFSAEFQKRLEREGAQSGALTVSLLWNNRNDLDLYVVCPSGEEIYFSHRTSACGGNLDVDMNVSPTSDEPVENIFWPASGAPSGRYEVKVRHFRQHEGCPDVTAFTVAVKTGAGVQEFRGSVRPNETKRVHQFDFSPAMMVTDAGNTSMGAALGLLARSISRDLMPEHGLAPVAVLVSDGEPTDDFEAGLQQLMAQPWGKKMVRIAIAVGSEADTESLRKFIGDNSFPVLTANNPEALVQHIKFVSTEVVKAASAPKSSVHGDSAVHHVPLPPPINPNGPVNATDVW